MDFPKRLDLLLFDRKFSYQQLADRLDTSKSQISRWLKGEVRPRSHKIREMAEIFDVPYAWLEEDKGYPVFQGNNIVILKEEDLDKQNALDEEDLDYMNRKVALLERDLFNLEQEEKEYFQQAKKRHEDQMKKIGKLEEYAQILREKIGGTSLLKLLKEEE